MHYQQPLPQGYICERCKEPGHHIRECPENGNPYYNPCQKRGIPLQHIWKTFITPNQFLSRAPEVFKTLLKHKDIYSLAEDGPTIEEVPPSLQCQLCGHLIAKAMLTPCCLSSCCYECLRLPLLGCLGGSGQACQRTSVCPLPHCREPDILVMDLIHNRALAQAAEWYLRQKQSRSSMD